LDLNSIQNLVATELERVQYRLRELLAGEVLDASMAEKLLASADNEGIVASLFLLTARATKGVTEENISMAAGCELFGLATWVHDAVIDDIPVQGWPRERMIIDGDHIFSLGLTLLTGGPEPSSEIAGDMIERMALGELEYVGEDISTSVERHTEMLRDKYGALFGASCELAALNGGVGREGLAHLRDYGRSLGTAYKIGSEILNFPDSVRRGRPALPILYASDNTGQIRRLFDKRDVEGLVELCSSNGGLRGAKARARELSKKALSFLSASDIDSSPMRDLCFWVGERVD